MNAALHRRCGLAGWKVQPASPFLCPPAGPLTFSWKRKAGIPALYSCVFFFSVRITEISSASAECSAERTSQCVWRKHWNSNGLTQQRRVAEQTKRREASGEQFNKTFSFYVVVCMCVCVFVPGRCGVSAAASRPCPLPGVELNGPVSAAVTREFKRGGLVD